VLLVYESLKERVRNNQRLRDRPSLDIARERRTVIKILERIPCLSSGRSNASQREGDYEKVKEGSICSFQCVYAWSYLVDRRISS